MKSLNIYALLVYAFLITANISLAQSNEIPTKEKYELVEIQGTITAIDKETREITLMGPEGEHYTVTASEDIKRFDEIKVGDVVTFDFFKYIKAEFRSPTEEELNEPLVLLGEAEKANMDEAPAAAIGAVVKALVTIQTIILQFMYVTVKGPNGNFNTIHMDDEELIKKLRVGQVVILTYGEAIAISLEKMD